MLADVHPDRGRVANQPRGDRPDLRRADRDQRARPRGLRRGGRAVRREAALPGAGRLDLRPRRQRAARRSERRLRAPGRRAARPRRADRARHRRRADARRPARRARRGRPQRAPRPRRRSATSSTTRTTSPSGSPACSRWVPGEAIITSETGCVAIVGERRRAPALRGRGSTQLEPVATVGSGDSFLAGYVAARYEGAAPRDCLAFGVACGAESTQHFGAGTLDRREVERLLPGSRWASSRSRPGSRDRERPPEGRG